MANWQHGAGALVIDGTLSRCRVWHNHAGFVGSNIYGGGVNVEKGVIEHSVIAFNTAGGAAAGGGGIAWRYASGPVLIDSCKVYGNAVPNGSGGGIAVLMGNPYLTIRNTEITGNSAGTKGGGVDLATYKPCVRLVDCTISGNAAKAGDADLSGTPRP